MSVLDPRGRRSKQARSPPKDKMVLHREIESGVLFQTRDLRLDGFELPFQPGNAPTPGGIRISFLGWHSAPQGLRWYQRSPNAEQSPAGSPVDVTLPPSASFIVRRSAAYAAERLRLLGTRHSVRFSLTHVNLPQRCRRWPKGGRLPCRQKRHGHVPVQGP